MAELELETKGFVFRCPVWTLVSKKNPGELLTGDLADGGKFICVFSDEDLALRYIGARDLQAEVQASEIPTNAALSVMLKLCHDAGVSLVAIDCKKMPGDAPAAYPVDALLQLLETPNSRETPVAGWQHLVRRRHSWRQQLYVKGRNMTARQLIGSMRANEFDEDKTAADFHLPVEVIREALAYVEANKQLLETEAEIERLMLTRGGVSRGPQPVSR
jgi:hypothetical protein